jgi:DNA helicase-2/ATP-dependent DNA helicase PcrA
VIEGAFNKISNLNKEQLDAVTVNHNGPVLVLAGAGSGKTTVLVNRIAFLLNSGVPQHKILALTYTHKAAQEMIARISKLELLSSTEKMPVITTFHGLALKILKEKDGVRNFERLGFDSQSSLISEKQRLELIASVSSVAQRKVLQVDLTGLDNLLESYSVFPERIGNQSHLQLEILNEIGSKLLTEKKKRALWDFSDLISGLIELFRVFSDCKSRYSEMFSEILVDEFQDTNPVQIEMLRYFLSPDCRLFAVGDDDQAIYGFRGADIRPTMEFGSYFGNALVLKLQTNYRSTAEILNKANKIFVDKPAAFRKTLVPAGKRIGKKPKKISFDNQEEMAGWIIVQAKRLSGEMGISISEMAALFRLNQTLDWVSEYWEKKNKHPDDCPQALTIHRSKGLEFPVVFLCDLEESVFPNYRLTEKTKIRTFSEAVKYCFTKHKKIMCDFEEEKRLFYVGITRAQRVLYFVNCRFKSVYGRKRRFEPSRFLKLV